MKVIQLLPTISFGDAVGNDARAIRRILEEQGYETQIYAENIDERLPKGTALSVSEIPSLRDDDIILYHASTGTELNYKLPSLGGRKMMIYHNITPPDFFKPYSQGAEQLCRSGLEGIRFLADKVEYCIADSEFNKQDLLRMGYTCPIDVCPILISFEDYEKKPDLGVLSCCRADGFTNILFVGRIAPNKKQEDVIAAFYYYHKYYNGESRLYLVGSWSGMDAYYRRLCDYVECLGLSEYVVFPGHITFHEILAYYHAADVFLCMSEHEGFCVPLVEAMYFKIPVVAYASSAIPETLGKCGLLLDEKKPAIVAAAIDRIIKSDTIRSYLREQQEKRIREFSFTQVRLILLEWIDNVMRG